MSVKPEKLSIDNICAGRARQLFERAMAEVNKNVRDPNTSAKAKRRITLSFTLAPFSDRTGAEVTAEIKTTLAPTEQVKGTIFISAAGGELQAYPKDVRQEHMFDEPASEKKQ